MTEFQTKVLSSLLDISGADPNSAPVTSTAEYHAEVLRLLGVASGDTPSGHGYGATVIELLQALGGTPIEVIASGEEWRASVLKMLGEISGASAATTSVLSEDEYQSETLRLLGAIAEGGLPLTYERIAGIKFDGAVWYETGEALTGGDDVTMTLDDTVTMGQNVFGSYNGTSSGTKNFSLFIYGNNSATGSYLRYGEQLLRPRFGNGERTITFGKSGTDGFLTDATATPETFTTVATAYIGMLPNSTSPAFSGSIIGEVLVGTRLRYIPCKRKADDVIGYFEAVTRTFIEPSGTGTPTVVS